MKQWLLFSAAFLTASVLFAFRFSQSKQVVDIQEKKLASLVRCAPDWNALEVWLQDADIPPMPGAGKHHWKISTSSDSAQFYFDQGMNMYYGFHIIESMASFKKAARFDPESPMTWWAQALAYGPNINDFGYRASPEALAATARAQSLLAKGNQVERALIAAMSLRYSPDSSQTRVGLNQAYARAMKRVYEQFNQPADLGVLYADALMLQHPWDLWFPDGRPKPWTPHIRQVLEMALLKSPNHPGANHYYIHVMEASPESDKALPSADRLGSISPGLSHMVHMPSHIYLRTGYFNKGAVVNEKALEQYDQYAKLFPAVKEAQFLYQLHNQHMQVNCGLMAGRYSYSQKAAQALQHSIDTSWLSLPAPMGSLVQYVYMTPILLDLRFEKWDAVLAAAKPSREHVYATLLYHFSRGMAFAALNQLEDARQEEHQVRFLLRDPSLKIPYQPFSAPVEAALTAHDMLLGSISMKEGNRKLALTQFQNAVKREEAMVYNEPRDWLLNPKQYLGAASMEAGEYERAALAFNRDLAVNSRNVWSLNGLLKTYERQKKTAQADEVRKQLKAAMELADVDFSKM